MNFWLEGKYARLGPGQMLRLHNDELWEHARESLDSQFDSVRDSDVAKIVKLFKEDHGQMSLAFSHDGTFTLYKKPIAKEPERASLMPLPPYTCDSELEE